MEWGPPCISARTRLPECNLHIVQVDPEAARIVFESGVPLTMVPLEVTHTALVTAAVLARLTSGVSSAGVSAPLRFLAAIRDLLLYFADICLRVRHAAAAAARPMRGGLRHRAAPVQGLFCKVHVPEPTFFCGIVGVKNVALLTQCRLNLLQLVAT